MVGSSRFSLELQAAGGPPHTELLRPHAAPRLAYIVEAVRSYHHARFERCAAEGINLHVVEAGESELGPASPLNHSYPLTRALPPRPARSREASAVEEALAAINPDVVAIPGWGFSYSLQALAWAKRHRRRTILLSDSNEFDFERKWLHEAIKRKVVAMADAALVAGTPHRKYIESLGMRREMIFDGYDVVDNDHFRSLADRARSNASAARRELGLPPAYLLVCCRLIEKKNVAAILEGFSRLSEEDARYQIIIVGDGPLRRSLEELSVTSGIYHRVQFRGWVSYNELPSYYGLAAALVHVPTREQWGLVLNEAAASGVAIITSPRCGARYELVENGVNGIVVPSTSAEDIASTLREFSALSDDAVEKMGIQSRRIVASWGLDRFASGLNEALQSCFTTSYITASWAGRAALRVLSKRIGQGVA